LRSKKGSQFRGSEGARKGEKETGGGKVGKSTGCREEVMETGRKGKRQLGRE